MSRTAKPLLVASVVLIATVAIATATIATAVWVANREVELSSDPLTVTDWCSRNKEAASRLGYTPVELVSDERDFTQHQELQAATFGFVFFNDPPAPIRSDFERFQRAVLRRFQGGGRRAGDLEAALRVQAFLNDCP